MRDWQYYNHAIIPTCAPNEVPNIEALKNRDIWKSAGGEAFIC